MGNLHAEYRPSVRHLFVPRTVIDPDSPEPEGALLELKGRSEALKEFQVRQARASFPAFMEYCFYDEKLGRPFQQQWYHEEWSRAMDRENRLLIVAPRDHGKTSQIVGRAIWELGRDPDLRIKIVCSADGRAKERLFEIATNIESNPRLNEVFPELEEDDRGEWSKHRLVVRRNARHRDASVEALGILSSAAGGRADLLIADDVVDHRNSLQMPALRKTIKHVWKNDWTQLLEPDSRIWGICTLWHKEDLNHELMENPVFRTLFYAVDSDFGAMWPDKWPEKHLRQRYLEIGSVNFNRGFRNQAVDEDQAIVRSGWIRYADLSGVAAFNGRLNELVFFTSYDTASSPTGKKEQDYTAGVTIAVDRDERRIYVVDAWHDRMTVKEQADRVLQEYKKYQPFRILIEKAGQSSLDEWVLNQAPELAGLVEVTKPTVSKAQRLMAVTPLMEMGEVIFSDHLDPDGEGWNPRKGSIVHELLDFPFGKHDDMVDAFSQALDGARRYFLDVWATGGENILDVTIGTDNEPKGRPRYYF